MAWISIYIIFDYQLPHNDSYTGWQLPVAREKCALLERLASGCWTLFAVTRWNWLQKWALNQNLCLIVLVTSRLATIARSLHKRCWFVWKNTLQLFPEAQSRNRKHSEQKLCLTIATNAFQNLQLLLWRQRFPMLHSFATSYQAKLEVFADKHLLMSYILQCPMSTN